MSRSPGPEDVAHLEARGDEMRDLLVRLADMSSGSLDPVGLASVREALRRQLERVAGDVADVEVGPGGEAVLVARTRPGAPLRALLCGHYDTVYGPDDPFRRAVLRDEGTLVGPGVADMKGGIVIMLAALEALEASLWAEGLGWEVLLVPDEELGSPRSGDLIVEASRHHHLGLVFEPALPGGALVRDRMGGGAFRLSARGRPAHAGRDRDQGRNAVLALSDAALAADGLNGEIDGAIVNVARMTGGGPENVVPAQATLVVGVRATSAATADRLEARLGEIAARAGARHGVAVAVDGRFHRPPRTVDGRCASLFATYRDCARALGADVEWADSAGSSDANLMTAAGLPTLDGLGPEGGGLHSPEEHCLLESLPRGAARSALFLMRLAAGQVPAEAIAGGAGEPLSERSP